MPFTITVEDKDGYEKRSASSLRINFLLSGALALIWAFSAGQERWHWGIMAGVFLFLVNQVKAARADMYFIEKLTIDNNQVEIHYTIKGQVLEVKGDISDFKFKKKHTINRTATPFLQIQYKNEVVIKQYRIDDWTEEKFNDVIAAI